MSRRTKKYDRKVDAAIDQMMVDLGVVETSDIVKAIDAKLMFANSRDNDASSIRFDAERHRLDAARMYVALRARITAEGKNWWKWHAAQFDRTSRDARRLLVLGSADDPAAALEQERANTRTRMSRSRSKADAQGGCASAPANVVLLAVKRITKEIEKLNHQQRQELWAALKEQWHGEIDATENANHHEGAGQHAATGH